MRGLSFILSVGYKVERSDVEISRVSLNSVQSLKEKGKQTEEKEENKAKGAPIAEKHYLLFRRINLSRVPYIYILSPAESKIIKFHPWDIMRLYKYPLKSFFSFIFFCIEAFGIGTTTILYIHKVYNFDNLFSLLKTLFPRCFYSTPSLFFHFFFTLFLHSTDQFYQIFESLTKNFSSRLCER